MNANASPHMKLHFTLLLLLTASLAVAGPRTSANYSILTDSIDAAGSRATSARYTNAASASSIAGISTIAAPAETAKTGYMGQLFEVAGLVLNSGAPGVNEAGTLQLAAWQLLDDATFLAVDAGAVNWGVVSGPVTGVSASGLATAGLTYQNTPATVQGTFGGFNGSLNFTVLDSIPDNFGTYAGDGLGDDWQVQYFGLPPNPAAGPLRDPDGDGQNNRYEWIAGLNPTDPASVFKLRISRSLQYPQLFFGPIVRGRTYTVTYGNNLFTLPPWPPLSAEFTAIVDEAGRTFLDTNAAAVVNRFYRIEITKP